MIISRTPFRISFFGGGTDYPAWYDRQPGAVLATTINKYAYITCRHLPPFFPHKTKIVWSKIEEVSDIAEIQHPSARATLNFMEVLDGVEIHHDGDLPARAGLGSSSAFTVGLLYALYALKGIMPTKMQLARTAIHIEQSVLKESVGSQDQVSAAFGGFNRITFENGHNIQVTPVVCAPARLQELQDHLILIFTGFSRNAPEIADAQIRATPQRGSTLNRMLAMVDEAIQIIGGTGDMTDFGRLLHESWKLKRGITPLITNADIDQIYERARKTGAIGGKLLGAGGGGFMLLFAKPEMQPSIRKALDRYLHVPFRFETLGSQIIFYEPNSTHA